LWKKPKQALYSIPFSKNRAVYEKIWQNKAERGWPQMKIWCMSIASWIPKATNEYS
jgi:hypothetical protein